MELPILHSNQPVNAADVLRFYLHAQQRWTEHLAEPARLDVGLAFANAAMAGVRHANQIVGAVLPAEMSAQDAFDRAAAHYAQMGLNAFGWALDPAGDGARQQLLAEHLLSRGCVAEKCDIMRLESMPRTDAAPPAGLQIIPARASFRHARELAEHAARRWNEPQLAEAHMLHLDDPHWDALLAIKDGQAVAGAGVLAVGDVGLIEDVFVVESHRRQGLGRAMMLRTLEICARALFRHILLAVSAETGAATALYGQLGFRRVGSVMTYWGPVASSR